MQTELVVVTNHTTLRWEDNIKMDIQEVGYDGMDWTHLVEDRGRWRTVVNAVKKTFGFHKMRRIS